MDTFALVRSYQKNITSIKFSTLQRRYCFDPTG